MKGRTHGFHFQSFLQARQERDSQTDSAPLPSPSRCCSTRSLSRGNSEILKLTLLFPTPVSRFHRFHVSPPVWRSHKGRGLAVLT